MDRAGSSALPRRPPRGPRSDCPPSTSGRPIARGVAAGAVLGAAATAVAGLALRHPVAEPSLTGPGHVSEVRPGRRGGIAIRAWPRHAAPFCAVIPGRGRRKPGRSAGRKPKFLRTWPASAAPSFQATVDRLPAARRATVWSWSPGTACRSGPWSAASPAPENVLASEPAGLHGRRPRREPSWRRDPDAILGSFAADHVITDEGAFDECIGGRSPPRRTATSSRSGITRRMPRPASATSSPASPWPVSAPPGTRQFVEARCRAGGRLSSNRASFGGTPGCSSSGRPVSSTCSPVAAALPPSRCAASPRRARTARRSQPTLPRIAIDQYDRRAGPPTQARWWSSPGAFGWDDVRRFRVPWAQTRSPRGASSSENPPHRGARQRRRHRRRRRTPGRTPRRPMTSSSSAPDAVLVTTETGPQDVRLVVPSTSGHRRGRLMV